MASPNHSILKKSSISTTPYTPPKHLSTGSFLTPQQLAVEYQEFVKSLKYVSTAPEMVFERLVASLKDALNESGEEGVKEVNDSDVKDSVAIGTGVKSDADSAAKPALRKDPFVGKYSATLKGVYCDGGFYQFKGFKIPLESGGYSSAIHNITLPVTFTKLKLNTPVSRKHSFSSSDHHIHVPVQTESYSSGSGSLKVAINWIEIGSEQGFQHGRVDTRCYNCYPWNETRSTKEIHVTFKSPYPAIPHVAVWFSDFTHEENNGERFEVKVHARATNVTTTGFVINVLEPKTEYFLEPIITWLAYPATRKDVFKGTFSTTKVGQKMFSSERGIRNSMTTDSLLHLAFLWVLSVELYCFSFISTLRTNVSRFIKGYPDE
ncbi:uncharacterized protein LAJ45_10712 [Morchella importuna]|uniref:uncharacterized protein n=1 Tax=Morchella importuna TaxID=1174673 RepID=UPI001E8D935F|nr:uncharacterized protein LAJ45_10712 [Morchella importuna]KAH8145275.1 hypothetical protein LAJ45_10712 [Morchella importuna]